MHLRSKLLLAGLTAALGMALATSAVSARKLSVSETSFTMTWPSFEALSSAGTVRCPLTLRGNFSSRTMSKFESIQVGSFTSANLGVICEGGSMTVLVETMPWSIRYRAFRGTLPRITNVEVEIVGLAIQVNIGGVACLARTDEFEEAIIEMSVDAATGRVWTIRFDEIHPIDLEDERFLCAIAGDSYVGGSGSMSAPTEFSFIFRLIG